MVNRMQFEVDGWIDPVVMKTAPVANPATAKELYDIALGSNADVDNAVKAAKRAFANFSQTTREQRISLLANFIEIYKDRAKESAMPSPMRLAHHKPWPSRCMQIPPSPISRVLWRCLSNIRLRSALAALSQFERPSACRNDHALELADQPNCVQSSARARRWRYDDSQAIGICAHMRPDLRGNP